MVVAPGADLALDMLEDDLTAGTPVMERALVRHALTLLRCPPDEDLNRRAGVLYRSGTDQVARVAIEQAIADALEGPPSHQAAAYQLLEAWQVETGGLALRARQIMARRAIAAKTIPILRPWELREQEQSPSVLQVINNVVNEEALEPDHRRILKDALASMIKAKRTVIDASLDDPLDIAESITVFAKVVLALTEHPANAAKLRGALRTWSSRRPRGADVLRETPYP
jgi:hypothetical protein